MGGTFRFFPTVSVTRGFRLYRDDEILQWHAQIYLKELGGYAFFHTIIRPRCTSINNI